MNIEVCEVGDLVYDPMGKDIGIITKKTYGLFEIFWPASKIYGGSLQTTEDHKQFVYHPDHNVDFCSGYCLLEDKEKYYEH
jgi:hypothetical protein